MAEGRMLKRRITMSQKMATVKTDKARLLWFYLLPFTDVDGRIEADCADIRDEIIRKQRKGYTLEKIEECLQDLHRVGLIILYTAGNNKRYLEITRFWDEQSHNPDREAKSGIPPPTQGVLSERSQTTPLKLSLSLREVKDNITEKELFGSFVLLTKKEYQNLVMNYGEYPTKKLINELNDYIGSTGRKYKSHYYTVLCWARRKNVPVIRPPQIKVEASEKPVIPPTPEKLAELKAGLEKLIKKQKPEKVENFEVKKQKQIAALMPRK